MRDTKELYAKQWATLTGRSEHDIYIPEGLRDEESTRRPNESRSAEAEDRGTK